MAVAVGLRAGASTRPAMVHQAALTQPTFACSLCRETESTGPAAKWVLATSARMTKGASAVLSLRGFGCPRGIRHGFWTGVRTYHKMTHRFGEASGKRGPRMVRRGADGAPREETTIVVRSSDGNSRQVSDTQAKPSK